MVLFEFLLVLSIFSMHLNATFAFEYDFDDDANTTAQTIIGGEIIKEGSRPYLVAVRSVDDDGIEGFCGGSLISPHAVMTAAHCLFYEGKWNPPQWIEFYRHDLCDDSGVLRVYLSADENQSDGDVFFHPDYDPLTNDNDVAVLLLSTPIYDIKPVILNTDPDVPAEGAPLDISGWGITDEGYGEVPRAEARFPRAVTLDYITNKACTTDPYKWIIDENITDQMMCAFAEEKDSCFGDSGL
jgi:secreted trypsin-like serine protease